MSRAYNVPPNIPVNLEIQTDNLNEKISIDPVDHFELMINVFANELKTSNTSLFDFEKDLLNQAKVMEAARISEKEKRYVAINEIQ